MPLTAGEALEAALRRKSDEHDSSLAQLHVVHANQLGHLHDYHDEHESKASSEHQRQIMELRSESEQRLDEARTEFAQQLREAGEVGEIKLQTQRDFYQSMLTTASREEMERRQEDSVAKQHQDERSTEAMLAVTIEQEPVMIEPLRQKCEAITSKIDQMSQLHKQELANLRDESERQKFE